MKPPTTFDKWLAVIVVVCGAPLWVLGVVYEILHEAFMDGRRAVRMWGQEKVVINKTGEPHG